MKPEILLINPIYPPVLAQIENSYTVRKLWLEADREQFVKSACRDVRAVITSGATGLPAGFIERLPSLELVACFGTPRGTIDLEAAAKRKVAVASTPDEIAGTVAELAAGMAVTLMRRIAQNDRFVRAGRWGKEAPAAGNTLIGKRCGIVGLGKIGRETAVRLQAFGMSIAYQGPRKKEDVKYAFHESVESLARESDCLIVTCPATPETRNLINRRILDALGPEGFLVNVARGSIVDEPELIEALKARRIAGAALDVFAAEPQVPSALMELDNVVLLPHVGSTTVEIREERGRKLMENLRAHFSGEPVPYPVKS